IHRLAQQTPDLQHVISPHGRVLFASPAVEHLLGYTPSEFSGKFVSEYVVREDCEYFTKELNRAATAGAFNDNDAALAIFCRFKRRDSTQVFVEIVGKAYFAPLDKQMDSTQDQSSQTTEISTFDDRPPRECKCFFLTARPYKTKNSVLLDSFLEHKMENIRLKKLIEDLKVKKQNKKDQLENSSEQMHFPAFLDSLENSHLRRYSAGDSANSITLQSRSSSRMNPSSSASSSASVTASTSPNEKFQYPIKLSPRISNEKSKKLKLSIHKDKVCTECGTLDSPEWRKGPQGPKTLCNACGLRWSKSLKK
ncbi:hypothetical protein V1514DRAFT_264834, partial [Lipomyces japonicus]|uniref:uncharacterized protein n=1 Tax=Lipomyces japonicus TaxID=56871 RepID=UPI0034CE75C8